METLKERILYLREVKHLSFYQIEALTGISRKRASRIYQGCARKNERQKKGSLLDAYHPLIMNWFSEYPSLKALQVYLWLKERGVAVSYPRVAQYTRQPEIGGLKAQTGNRIQPPLLRILPPLRF